MGDMQTVAAQLRISRGLEEDANDQDGGDSRDEERVEEFRIGRSDQVRRTRIRVAGHTRHYAILGAGSGAGSNRLSSRSRLAAAREEVRWLGYFERRSRSLRSS